MYLSKRQGYPNDGYYQQSSGFYYREWAVLAAVVLFLFALVCFLRATGRRRIAQNKPLLWFHKYLFPKSFRDGPPYQQPVPLDNYQGTTTRFGHYQTSTVAPPPPSYDPYATNLPAYQPAKVDSSYVGTSELPSSSTAPAIDSTAAARSYPEQDFVYTIPEATTRR